jgi:hypothetical protein
LNKGNIKLNNIINKMKKLSNTKKSNDNNDNNLINLTYVNNRIEQEVCNET